MMHHLGIITNLIYIFPTQNKYTYISFGSKFLIRSNDGFDLFIGNLGWNISIPI
jgi:hypothetical protein